MEARRSRAARGRSDLRRLGRAAAGGPLPAQAGAETGARPLLLRAARFEDAAAKTPSAAVLGTAHDLFLSFTKKMKGGIKKKKKREKKGEG